MSVAPLGYVVKDFSSQFPERDMQHSPGLSRTRGYPGLIAKHVLYPNGVAVEIDPHVGTTLSVSVARVQAGDSWELISCC